MWKVLILMSALLFGAIANAAEPVVRGPEAAPAVEVAVPGTTEVVVTAEVAGPFEGMSFRERRQLGFTRTAAVRAAIKLSKDGELPSLQGLEGDELEAAKASVREAIAQQIVVDNIDQWKAVGDEGRDWASFFEALADFLERIMPLIQMIIDMFS